MSLIKTFDKERFSADVADYRAQRKVSRYKLWQEIGGTDYETISNIENKQTRPSIDIAYNLCELMGKNINDYMK